MKRFKNILSALTFLVLLTSLKSVFPQSVGIGSSTFTPLTSSILEVRSSNKGILIPRIILTGSNDATTISAPSNSLLIYNTATVSGANAVSPGFYYRDSVNSIWVRLFSGNANGWSLTGNTGTAPGTNFIGTTDNVALAFRTNNNEQMRIGSDGNVGIGSNPITKTKLYIRTSGGVAGTGYGTNVSSGIYATSYGNAAYTFGITGIGNSNSQPRSGGVFGSINNNYTWGALGFVDSLGVNYGGYFTGFGSNNAAFFNGKVFVTEQLTTTSNAAAISNKTANYSLTATDYTIIFKSASILTATLPAASVCSGRIYVIVNQGSASLTISSYQNLSDVAANSLTSGTSITIQSNGTNWYQIR